MITSRARALAIGAVLVCGISAVGCGSDDDPEESTATTAAAATPTTAASDTPERGVISVGGIFARSVTRDLDIGAFEAVDAFFQEINENGGVNGYTFEFEGIDDQGDPAQFASAVERLTSSGVDVIISSAQTEVPGGLALLQETGIPYIGGNAHARDILETPNVFPTGANLQNGIAAVIETLMTTSEPPAETASVTGVNHPSVAPAVEGAVARLGDAGIDVTTTGSFELTETDFTGVAAQIVDADADGAVIYALNTQMPGIVGALEQQGYEGSIFGGSYDAAMAGQVGGYGDGRFLSVQPWAAFEAGEAGDEAQAIVQERYPDVDLLSGRKAMDAWTSAEILVGAIEALGDTELTSESLIDALNSLTDFETTFMAPITYEAGPEGHLDVSNCMQALKVEDGEWVVAGEERFTCWEGSVAPS